MKTEEAIEVLEDEIKRYKERIELLRKLDGIPADSVHAYYSPTTITIKSLEELRGVRGFLREKLGSWTDRNNRIWASGTRGLASWCDTDHLEIEIWLEGPIVDFPPELQGENCGFAEIEKPPKTEFAYVCQKESE